MFEKKKIINNHIKSSNSNDRRVSSFYKLISEELIERCKIKKTYAGRFLELESRNNFIFNKLKQLKLEKEFYQTILSSKVLIKNKNKFVCESNIYPFKKNYFDFCFNVLSFNNAEDIVLSYKKVYELLKKDGKFISVLPAEENLKEFRKIFFDIYSNFNSFTPVIKMTDLAMIGSTAGFKDIVIDKTELKLKINHPTDLWSFIRNLGESNTHKNRNRLIINKEQYKNLCCQIEKKIIRKKLSLDISINFFIGSK